MNHLKFFSLAIDLVDKASDGELTSEEIRICCSDNFPVIYGKIEESVNEALKDGKITVWETMKILVNLID